jgi:ribosomal protein L44E
MFDIPTASLPRLKDLPATGGLSVELVPVLDGVPEGTRTLAVALNDRQYMDIFSVFCADLVTRMSACTNTSDAIVLLLNRLERWQLFLGRAVDGLNQQEQIGLFGELWILREILIPFGGIGMVDAWCGAQRAPQDFIVPGVCAIEVKTTAARTLSHVRVHGETQLDGTGLTCLFLACVRLERDAATAETLNDLVDGLKSVVAAPEFAAVLEQRIAAAGWFERHRQRYQANRFAIAQRRFFRVEDGFPRLRRAELATGIDEVAYRVDLRACQAAECAQAEVESELLRLQLHSRHRS